MSEELKQKLRGEVCRNIGRMFATHGAASLYLVNNDRGPDQSLDMEWLTAVCKATSMQIARNIAATGGGSPTLLYLDVNLDQFQPFQHIEGLYLHLERSASRLAAMLRPLHRVIGYCGIVVTVGAPSYRQELFTIDPARAMLHFCRGLNNHLPHVSSEMVGYYVEGDEAARFGLPYVPVHSFMFNFTPAATAEESTSLSLPSWTVLTGDTPLAELLNIPSEPAEAEPQDEDAAVETVQPTLVEIESEVVDPEPNLEDDSELAPELAPEPAAEEVVQAGQNLIEAAANLKEIMGEVELGSRLLSAGGRLKADGTSISYVVFPAMIGPELVRMAFCQNGTFVVAEPDPSLALAVSLVVGNQMVIDLIDGADKKVEPFSPEPLGYLQGQLDRNDLMEFYLNALIEAELEHDETLATYFGGQEQLREQLEVFFEVLPTKLGD